MERESELQASLAAGDVERVTALVSELLEASEETPASILQSLVSGMVVVGERMAAGDLFIPEVLASAVAMKAGMERLKPRLTEQPTFAGKAVMGQVAGDVHSIGRKFVNLMLESAGFAVVDLGDDVPASRFVEAVREERPEIVGLSALLTSTMPNMKAVIEALRRSGGRNEVKVIVGGAPVTQEFADAIGADGYAPDAISAVKKVRELIGQEDES
jgi:5-methyltetrahydrofolate--homocysteine methyltransferase